MIAAKNMTLDGFCDHTAIIADEEILRDCMDKLIDELAKGKKMEKILRSPE